MDKPERVRIMKFNFLKCSQVIYVLRRGAFFVKIKHSILYDTASAVNDCMRHVCPLPPKRYIFSTRPKLEALAIALKNSNRRTLMEALKIGVIYGAEVTCVGLRGVKAEMISGREGKYLYCSAP